MSKRDEFSPPLVGICSLLVILAVLVITVFGMLSLSTVLADKRLSEASTNAVIAYYEADCAAEEIFAPPKIRQRALSRISGFEPQTSPPEEEPCK